MAYTFVTVWYIQAPLDAVCDVICESMAWPQWWPNVERVEELIPCDVHGLGGVRRYTWHGRLPYRFSFDVRVVHFVPLQVIEGHAKGDLEGVGRWLFSVDGDVTIVRYEWRIRITSVWLRLLARFARPLIRWNHNAVMQQGGEALALKVKASSLRVMHL